MNKLGYIYVVKHKFVYMPILRCKGNTFFSHDQIFL